MIYFISCHVDITYEDFFIKYKERIDLAVNDTDSWFIMGDANRADLYAQNYLFEKVNNNRIMVYQCKNHHKNNPHCYPTRGNFKNHTQKDKAMTQHSNVDILWIRPKEDTKLMYGDNYNENRISGTESKFIRRNKTLV